MYRSIVSFLIVWFVNRCLRAGRYVTYVHQGRFYLRRYAVFGYLTGDRLGWLRSRLPNLYIHQMINPDLDPALHNHPWPWAISWIALGGYRETRMTPGVDHQLERTLTTVWHADRWHRAPAINRLSGSTFHRIAEINPSLIRSKKCRGGYLKGTFTFFLAGPRRNAKPWGYLVPGQGYVPHRERHENFGGVEIRGEPIDV